ncbi:543fd8d9-ebb1-40d1-9fd2-fe945e6c5387 [Thermothielavioides terrestris]|uniref:543fd8d9-ebb1-40d1-9fd2-fe945e6c5387 n=1 Tax=Thermothielavioides terrestris TaxID=2587410 RepID=A0A3S4CB39_9PEZI|nr:543fd8d9-ebb1-40d1-9fd2-fe945e6c5387 [Thermothielavioides terrestris]
MPTHYTPLQTPTDISSPLLSTPSRSDRYSPSNPGSSSPSTPSSRRSQPSHRKHGGKKATETDEPKTATEAPYLFLGSIAAASLLAHKYWPKGFLYGPKEDWELAATKSAPRSKQRRVAENSRVPVVTTVALVVSLARGDESVGGSMSWRRRRRR